jgi:peptide deformylase
MSLLEIAQVGHPVLRQSARPLLPEELASHSVQTFIDDLIETMRAANGAGLAANQVHNPVQICALEVQDNPRYPYKPNIPLTVLINPVITPISGETFSNFEGCLSVPNLRGRVQRHAEIRVQALDRHGAPLDFEARGITAGTYQHEVDHLLGRLFIDQIQDPASFCTWEEFENHHQAQFAREALALVEKWGS